MKRKVKEEEVMEVDKEENEEIKEEDEENGVVKNKNNEEAMPDSSSTVAPEDRDVFKVLGKQEMKNLEALKITSSWVQNATTFSATIDASTSESLSSIGIPSFLQIPSTISSWFPVQNAVLPSLISQIQAPPPLRPRDVAIAAPTGSGKTICYVVPVLTAVGNTPSNTLFAVILVPAQTLVTQIVEEFRKWNGGTAKVVSLSGANDFDKEARLLASDPPNVIVATPARLAHHLTSEIPPPIDLSKLRFLIVDEADRMGKLMREEWMDLVEFLCGGMERVGCLNDILRQRRAPQKIVLSATLSKDVEELHLWNLFKPRLFSATATKVKDITSSSSQMDHISGRLALPSSISHRLVVSDPKFHPLAVFQQIHRNQFNRTIIFVNEISSSNRLAHVLKELCKGDYEVDYFTAQLFGKRRYKMLEKFNRNPKRILISSDVLARGTDLSHVDCVINYNLPSDDKLFVHRAGRTGRAGNEGHVISVGDKETKRLFVKMLKTTRLWGDTVEEFMEEYQFEKDMDRYSKALESLKSVVSSTERRRQSSGAVASKRSGFEAKRKSRPNKKGEKPWLKKKMET
uniref:ATP-dependent RNA helicase n=1 Tax=Caenorhabditis tropicalis TaxID=1561998 RepID=A0A1I7ULS1_9PELO